MWLLRLLRLADFAVVVVVFVEVVVENDADDVVAAVEDVVVVVSFILNHVLDSSICMIIASLLEN